MSDQLHDRALWQRVEELPDPLPWRNAPNQTSFRSYSHDAKLEIEEDRLRIAVHSARRFVTAFGSFFIPAFSLIAWFAIPDVPTRLLFSIGGFIVGIFMFALIYGMLAHHENLGDYLVIDRAAETITLPQSKVEFALDQVYAFQWISGRTESIPEEETDLNLLVADEDGLLRYHILGSPQRAMIEEVVRFSGIKLQEISPTTGVYRDADSATV